MAYLSAARALPQHLWATVRLLADRGPMPVELAGKLLSPPALEPDAATFREATRRLIELGIVHADVGVLTLAGTFRGLDEFVIALRQALFAPERNVDLMTNQTAGSKDITILAAYLLDHDPLDEPVTDKIIYRDIDRRKFGKGLDTSNAARNSTRWNDFRHWAPALGLAASPLFGGSESAALAPDCTVAVRQVVHCLAANSTCTLAAMDLVDVLRGEIPVLPGGQYSRELDIPDPGPRSVDPALSFALLRGRYEGWLRLHQRDDAQTSVTLTGRTTPDLRIANVTISFEGMS